MGITALNLILAVAGLQQSSLTAPMRSQATAIIPEFRLANELSLRAAFATGEPEAMNLGPQYKAFNSDGLVLAFWRDSGQLAFGVAPPDRKGQSTGPHSDDYYRELAKKAWGKFSPGTGMTLNARVTKEPAESVGGDISVDITPTVSGRTCMNGALFRYDSASGALVSFRIEPFLDHSRFRNHSVITSTQAEIAAVSNYGAWRPFPLAYPSCPPILYSGCLSIGSGGISQSWANQETVSLWREGVATPYWLFQFESTTLEGRKGSIQRVYVDAITGTTLGIDQFLVLASGSQRAPIKFGEKLAARASSKSGWLRRSQAESSSGLPIVLQVREALVRGRFDKDRGLVFLPEGKSWVTYKPDKVLRAVLSKSSR